LKHIILFLFSIKPNNDIGFDFSLYSLLSNNLVKYTNDSNHVGEQMNEVFRFYNIDFNSCC